MPAPARVYAGDAAAHELLEQAHHAGYRYPADFPGFEAVIEAYRTGSITTGRLRVAGPRHICIDVDADRDAWGWLERELGSIVGHRWALPYHDADGRHTLRLGPADDHPLGRLVIVEDDHFDSSYRVRDGQISQVDRHMGTSRFSILIQERTATAEGRTLPSHFTVVHWDTQHDRLVRTEVYDDRYVTVDGFPLPWLRRITVADDTGVAVRQVHLRNHRLLH